jgi:hypothetical protein
MKRWVLWPILVLGIVLIVVPLVISMPGKASDGQEMLDEFRPIMSPSTVELTADYYDNVFTKLRPIALALNEETVAKFNQYGQGIVAVQKESATLTPTLAQATGQTPEQVQQFLGQQFPAMSQLFASLPQLSQDFGGLLALMGPNVPVFERVPPGLDHYEPLVRTMESQVSNYESVDSLPPFALMAWAFVAIGIFLVVFSAIGLFTGRRSTKLAA